MVASVPRTRPPHLRKADRDRALALLASCRDGCPEAMPLVPCLANVSSTSSGPAPGVHLKNGIYFRNQLAGLENGLAARIEADTHVPVRGRQRVKVRRIEHFEVIRCLAKTWHIGLPLLYRRERDCLSATDACEPIRVPPRLEWLPDSPKLY